MADNNCLLHRHYTQEINMSDKFTAPEFKVNASRNGYELRTDILGMAKNMVTDDFHAKFHGWEITSVRDQKTSQIVTKVGMPEYPGLDKVLETAERMYAFVNQTIKK